MGRLRCKWFGHRGHKYSCGKGKLIAEVFQCGRCEYVLTTYWESMGRNRGMARLETVEERPSFVWEWYQTTIWGV